MKKNILLLVFNLITLFTFSQSLKTEKYELFFLNLEENSINISKDMKMGNKTQYFYEGTIEVTYMDSGASKKFNFFFSCWDDEYKEFRVKDTDLNVVKPQIFFKDKATAIIKNTEEDVSINLIDNSNIESSILSSMIVWLDNKNNS